MCTVLLKDLICWSACFRRGLSSLLGVYAVEDVVLVQALEEGISCFVALLAVGPRRRFESAACGFLDTALFRLARAPG